MPGRTNPLARPLLVSIVVFFFFVLPLAAQTICVDATPSHATNSVVPAQALGAGIDRLPLGATDKTFIEPTIKQVLSSGWQTISYRQNTELHIEAWLWNPEGTWSDPAGKGYFTGSATSSGFIRHSFGYGLPHRGVTRNDGTGTVGFSRLTDGDEGTYWKSNPYLSSRFTGEDDSLHPQWVILDLSREELVDSLKISWADPYATDYVIQYWTGLNPIRLPPRGSWITFPHAVIPGAHGGMATQMLSDLPVRLRFVRI